MSIKELPPQLESSLLQENGPVHVPVLLDAVCDVLKPQKGESYLDLTAWYGGHARRILEVTENIPGSVLVDRDSFAVQAVQDIVRQGAQMYETDFVSAARDLVNEGKQFDMILADLGVSSPQLDRGERGFSFQADGPLDMRMDQRQERTAADVVNHYSRDRLVDIITRYGEEPRAVARRIADEIIAARPFQTTAELAAVV
jgi:16S rRNA (cytosine1402-N4)-methyltransferase